MSTLTSNSDPINPEFVSDVVWKPGTYFVQKVVVGPPSKSKSRRHPQPKVPQQPIQQIQVSQVKDIRHKQTSEQSTQNRLGPLGGGQNGSRRRNRGKNFNNKGKEKQQGNREESTRICAFRISNSKPALPVLREQDKEPRKQKLKGKFARKIHAKALIKSKLPSPKRPSEELGYPEFTHTEKINYFLETFGENNKKRLSRHSHSSNSNFSNSNSAVTVIYKELKPTDTPQSPKINKTVMSGKEQNPQQSTANAKSAPAKAKGNPSRDQPPPTKVQSSEPTYTLPPPGETTHYFSPTEPLPRTELNTLQRFYVGQCDRDGNGSFFCSPEQLQRTGHINLIVSHVGPFSYRSWSGPPENTYISYTESIEKFDDKMNTHYKGKCGSRLEASKVDVCYRKGYYSVKEEEQDDDGNSFDQWYRIQVMEDGGVRNSQVKAFFIDHGKVKMVDKKNLRFLCTPMASPVHEPLEAGFRYQAQAYHAQINIERYSKWFVEELRDHLSRAANAKIWYTFEVKNMETKEDRMEYPLLTLSPPAELTSPT